MGFGHTWCKSDVRAERCNFYFVGSLNMTERCTAGTDRIGRDPSSFLADFPESEDELRKTPELSVVTELCD